MAKTTTHVCTFDNCGKTFQKASRLISHSRCHNGEKPFVCTHGSCGNRFKRSDHLRRHILSCHWSDVQQDAQTPPPVFSCDEEGCTAKFRSAQNLKKHIRRSHEVDSFKCHICGEVFKKHHQLKSHRDKHTEEKHVCPVEGCGKSYTFPTKLRRHMKIHEGYPCKEEGCGEKFDKWTLLVKHNRLKHGTVHQCSICDKVFSQKQWLKQHMLVHADERHVYPCTYENCSREYLDVRNLKVHISSYHGGQRFPCTDEECGQTFSTKQKLQQHLKLHDPTRPLPTKKKPKRKLLAEKLTGCSEKKAVCEESDFVLNSPVTEFRNTCDLSHLNSPNSCDFTVNIHEPKHTGCLTKEDSCDLSHLKSPLRSDLNLNIHEPKQTGYLTKEDSCDISLKSDLNLNIHETQQTGSLSKGDSDVKDLDERRTVLEEPQSVFS